MYVCVVFAFFGDCFLCYLWEMMQVQLDSILMNLLTSSLSGPRLGSISLQITKTNKSLNPGPGTRRRVGAWSIGDPAENDLLKLKS